MVHGLSPTEITARTTASSYSAQQLIRPSHNLNRFSSQTQQNLSQNLLTRAKDSISLTPLRRVIYNYWPRGQHKSDISREQLETDTHEHAEMKSLYIVPDVVRFRQSILLLFRVHIIRIFQYTCVFLCDNDCHYLPYHYIIPMSLTCEDLADVRPLCRE